MLLSVARCRRTCCSGRGASTPSRIPSRCRRCFTIFRSGSSFIQAVIAEWVSTFWSMRGRRSASLLVTPLGKT
eukprot:6316270-Pyramimonas_sp.AAC.1